MVAVLVAAGLPGHAGALDPGREIRQLHHTRWTVEDGAPPDIWAIAQAIDGYLWLGTGAGLYRFDGVRFERFVPAAGERMPSSNITALFASPAGDLWIGYVSGHVSRLRGGRLTTFDVRLPGAMVWQITGDRAGVVWAVLNGAQHGGVVRFDSARPVIIDARFGLPPGGATAVLAARDGTVWVNAGGRLFAKRPGARRFAPTGVRPRSVSSVSEDRTGGVWVSNGKEGRPRLIAGGRDLGRAPPVHPPPAPEAEIGRMIIDRDGALWGTYLVGGVFRLAHAAAECRPERFSLGDGLSSDIARPVLEDREGNIWVGSNLGLDRFRATNVAVATGIPPTSRQGYYVAPGSGGSVYVAMGERLYVVDPAGMARRMPDLPTAATFLYADRRRTVWIGLKRGLARLDGGRVRPEPLPAAAMGSSIAWMQDTRGRPCIAVLRAGIFCNAGEGWRPNRLGLSTSPASPWQMLTDRLGRVWLNYEGELAMVENGRMRRFNPGDGLTVGKIGVIADGSAGVLVGGDFGLARYDGHGFVTLDAARHPVLGRLAGVVTTAAGDIWLNGINGVVRMAPDDLRTAFARPAQPLRYTLYDMKDGLPGVAQQDSDTPTAVEAGDGRLWFVTSHGMAWLDPHRIARNPVPPPVLIRSVTADGVEHAFQRSLNLPAGTSHLQVDFTALSLSVPERVRFRYRLSGVDEGWIDAGPRRQAFYTNLGPGSYRFLVVAANNDGVWNRTGASMSVTIAPTFIQGAWFKLLVAACVLAAGYLVYSLRVRQITDGVRGRLEERLRERERIARELHDTLLQGFQGLVFRFQAAIERMPPGPVREAVERALDQADDVLAEGRRRVLDLRTGRTDADISDLLAHSAERFLAGSSAAFRVIVEGRARKLHRLVQEELCRIAEEALSNAAQHARAGNIEVGVAYRVNALVLVVRDNGCGMAPNAAAEAGRAGHFGITGMRERAEKIGATLVIASHRGAGTEVALTLPAALAFARPSGRRRPRQAVVLAEMS